MPSKNRLTINLSEEEFAALARLAKKSRVSKAWLGRHAIESFLAGARADQHELPLPLSGLDNGGNS
jgi:predicted transcriptional regulator